MVLAFIVAIQQLYISLIVAIQQFYLQIVLFLSDYGAILNVLLSVGRNFSLYMVGSLLG